MLTGAAEEGGAWYPAWPHNLPSTQQTEMQSRSPGNSVKLKQSWRRQHQQHPHSPHRKPPQRGAHPHRLCPLPHNPSSTRRTTSSCLSPRSSPQSPGRLAQQCCKRVIQQIAHQYFWHRTLSECPRCTAPTPACGQGVWRRGAAGMVRAATSRARLLPLGRGAQHGQSSTRLHQTTSALLRSSHRAPTSVRRARSTPALLLRLQDHGQVARAHIICGLMDETTGWEENTYSATIYQGQKLEHN